MPFKTKPTLTLLGPAVAHFRPAFASTVMATAVLLSLAACSGSKWHEAQRAPNTGDPIAEKQIAPPPQAEFTRGQPGFVSTDHLPARSSADQPVEKAPSHLERNDKIEVVDPAPAADPSSMEAVVTSSGQPEMVGKKVFVKKAYVADKPVVPTNEQNDADKYFVIQNVATEKLRVYRTCASKDAAGACVNKLVLETDMVAGENVESRRTLLGSYRVDSWHKFYEDHSHYFPSFYDPTYPAVPAKGSHASMQEWMDSKYLPKQKGGVFRGSFGWYTAYLTPRAATQWTHGTFGWGEDGTKFILAMKNGEGVDERSQGCTRVENQAIALMREILPAGSRMVKIYAREDLADASLSRYRVSGQASWKWVLTKKRGEDAPKAGAKWAKGVGADEILDNGTYKLDQHPDVAEGDLYKVGAENMHGVFLVDEGTLVGYKHPAGLKVGGESDNSVPSVMISHRSRASLLARSVEGASDAAQAKPDQAKAQPALKPAAQPAAQPAQSAAPASLKDAPSEMTGAAATKPHGFVRPDQEAAAANVGDET